MLHKLKYVHFEQLAELPVHDCVNLVAIVSKVGPMGTVTLKKGEQRVRQNLLLVDESKYSIVACMWSVKDAETLPKVK